MISCDRRIQTFKVLDMLPVLDGITRGGFGDAAEDFEKCGFTCAITPDDANAIALLNFK